MATGAAVSLAPRGAVAQSGADAAARSATTDSLERWHLDQCLGGLSYGPPFKLALSYGGGLIRESHTGGADWCAFGAAKVGFGAARGSIGLARSTGPLASGAAVSGGVLRTFGNAWNATRRSTYVGASIHVWPLLGLGGEVGYYTRVGANRSAFDHERNIVVFALGFGF